MKRNSTLLLIVTFIFSLSAHAQEPPKQENTKTADMAAAARLLDLKFSQQELDTMYEGVQENLANYRLMHGQALANQVPMSLWQNPLLPGMKLDTRADKIKWKLPATELPANKNELAFYSLGQLAYLIKNKKISSTELTEFFIQRIKKYGDTLHCVISITEDIAREQARAADEEIAAGKYRGPLHGIPYGLKDLFAVKSTKTTWGAAPYQNQVIDEDAFVYQQLKSAGAVLVAKFTLGALAMGDYWYGGRTRNPWNISTGSSGSSAGSASATAAGLVPFAIGTETWGSIISPASTCGLTGMRPTFGSVSRSGGMTLSWSLDKIGPICRSATDAAMVFAYIHGTDGEDASAVNARFNYQPNTSRSLKIAYAKNYYNRITDTTRSEWKVLQAFRDAGYTLIPVDFPDSTAYPFNIMDVVISAEAAAAFDDFTRNNVDDEMTRQGKYDWPNSFRVSRLMSAVEYVNANRHRYLLMKKMQELMSTVDVIICPTRGSGNQSAITNLTGHPAICVPTGFDIRNKLPTSITFIGQLYEEGKLISAVEAYQDITNWHLQHPEWVKQ
ncbi:MAG: amidase [Chitinophagia bacterium]|jgi:Asp-tRNA(Asn)/Glu-tRNA(Gln) amidotransferase A subunit family amidase